MIVRFLAITFLLTAQAGTGIAQVLELSTFQKSPSQHLSSQILTESYQLLGIDLRIYHIPGEKALIYAEQGEVDGEVSRMTGAEKKFENLIRVPEPVNYLDAAVFTKNIDTDISGWDSLSDYVIGVPLGARFVTHPTRNMRQVLIPSDRQLMTMLAMSELELVVNPLINGMGRIKQGQMFHVRVLHPSLAREYLYHYLHKKHEQLVPKIAQAIQSLRDSGRLAEIRQEFIEALK